MHDLQLLRVPGTFDWSDDGRQLTFVGRDITLSRVARIDTGQSVRIDYRFETDSLVFFSRITESPEPGCWQLSQPRSVQRLSRRDNDRQALPESAGVRLAMMTNQGLQSYPVADLSSGGAAVRYNASEVGLWVGRRVTVWLETGSSECLSPSRCGMSLVGDAVRDTNSQGCALWIQDWMSDAPSTNCCSANDLTAGPASLGGV